MDAVKNLNGTVWVFASLLIAMVIIQALLFLRLALNFNKKNNLATKAEIVSAARSIGIDAKVNMQSGVIYVNGTMTMPEVGLPLADIIRNLEDQVEDRNSSVDKDDPDCIFRRDVIALREAVRLLRRLEVQS